MCLKFLPGKNTQEASKNRMKESEPTQKLTLKRRVGYGEYTDEEGDERMEVDKHVGQRPKTG
jgi:hypothetical protein